MYLNKELERWFIVLRALSVLAENQISINCIYTRLFKMT